MGRSYKKVFMQDKTIRKNIFRQLTACPINRNLRVSSFRILSYAEYRQNEIKSAIDMLLPSVDKGPHGFGG